MFVCVLVPYNHIGVTHSTKDQLIGDGMCNWVQSSCLKLLKSLVKSLVLVGFRFRPRLVMLRVSYQEGGYLCVCVGAVT